eukprot:TRINITY_DN261_c1_g2_i1.p1 TRINITY_DN261_c1_g2~~TRINITY_DN261_c1_g2_i1.p1  ORF type:complete len:550 (+),score=230.22 TRINITY_DN261_c1_g2_i1:71-1720(+)
MAPKKAVVSTKRAAETAPAEEPPSKRLAAVLKKHSVNQSLYKHIVDIVEHPLAQHVSQDSRAMLLAMLPHSLCVPSDERQEFQEAAVKMLSQLMSQILAAMQTSLDAENERVAGIEAKKEQLEQKIQACEAAVNAAQEVTAAQQAGFDITCDATRKAHAELAGAKEELKACEAAQASAQGDKDALQAAVMGDFEKLKSGSAEGTAPEQLYSNLEPLMLKLDLDTSLRSAMKPALLKTPAQRGFFDGKVVEELEKTFAAKVEELTNVVADGQSTIAVRAAVVSAAEDKVAQAEAVQKAASDTLASARDAQKAAQADLKASKAILSDFKPEYKKATESCNQQQDQLQTYMDVNVAAFNILESKISAKKKKEIAAAAAEAKAAAKAAAEAEAQALAAAEAQAAAEAAAEAEAEAAAAAEAQAAAKAAADAEAEALAAAEARAAAKAAAEAEAAKATAEAEAEALAAAEARAAAAAAKAAAEAEAQDVEVETAAPAASEEESAVAQEAAAMDVSEPASESAVMDVTTEMSVDEAPKVAVLPQVSLATAAELGA